MILNILKIVLDFEIVKSSGNLRHKEVRRMKEIVPRPLLGEDIKVGKEREDENIYGKELFRRKNHLHSMEWILLFISSKPVNLTLVSEILYHFKIIPYFVLIRTFPFHVYRCCKAKVNSETPPTD